MNISGITIYNDDLDHWIESDSPSERTTKFLTGIFLSPLFQKRVAVYRKYFKLPLEGLLDLPSKDTGKHFSHYWEVSNEIDFLFDFMGYPNKSIEGFNLYLLVNYNAFFDRQYSIQPFLIKENAQIEVFDPKSEGQIFPDYSPYNVTLVISRKMSVNKLKQWITWNKNELDQKLSVLPKSYDEDGLEEINLCLEMDDLYRKGNTPSQISNLLINKYPDNEFLCDHAWVANKLQRFKQRNQKYQESDIKSPSPYFFSTFNDLNKMLNEYH